MHKKSAEIIHIEEYLSTRDLSDRTITNFLWFCKFERSFLSVENPEKIPEVSPWEKLLRFEAKRRGIHYDP